MNSEVKSWNLNEFYTWNDFKQMPKDIQIEYLQGLTNKYKVGAAAIEKSLFQIGRTTLIAYLQKHLMMDKIKWITFKGGKAQAYNAEFERTVDKYRLAIVDTLPPVSEIEGEINDKPQAVEEEPQVTFDGIKKYANTTSPEGPYFVTQPEVPIIDTDIFKSSPRNCVMESDGFDLELFKYLAKRYQNKSCAVEIRVIVKG